MRSSLSYFLISIIIVTFVTGCSGSKAVDEAKVNSLLTEATQNYWSSTDLESALKSFNTILDMDANNVIALTYRGGVYRALEKWDLAMGDFTRALELDSQSSLTYAFRARWHQAKGNTQQALQDANHAVEISPNSALAHYYRGRMYYSSSEKNKVDKALEDLNAAIKYDDHKIQFLTSEFFRYRGGIYYFAEKDDLALADLNRSIALSGTNAIALAYRGDIYRIKGEKEKALTDLKKAHDLDPNYKWAEEHLMMAINDCPSTASYSSGIIWDVSGSGWASSCFYAYEGEIVEFSTTNDRYVITAPSGRKLVDSSSRKTVTLPATGIYKVQVAYTFTSTEFTEPNCETQAGWDGDAQVNFEVCDNGHLVDVNGNGRVNIDWKVK